MALRNGWLAAFILMIFTSCNTIVQSASPSPTKGNPTEPLPTAELGSTADPTSVPSVIFAMYASRAGTGQWDIVTWAAVSESVTMVTDDDATEDSPRWSPDGATLVFSSNRAGQRGLYVYDVRAQNTQELLQDGNFNFGPSWSLDGSQVIYSALHDLNDDNERARIKILGLSDGAIETLVMRDGWEYSYPQFSPDGSSIYTVASINGTMDIVVRAIATSDEHRLPFLEALTDFRLSPDGTKIALGTYQGVCLGDLSSREDDCMVIAEGDHVAYDWSDSGDLLYYVETDNDNSTVMSYSPATGQRQEVGHIEGWHVVSMSFQPNAGGE